MGPEISRLLEQICQIAACQQSTHLLVLQWHKSAAAGLLVQLLSSMTAPRRGDASTSSGEGILGDSYRPAHAQNPDVGCRCCSGRASRRNQCLSTAAGGATRLSHTSIQQPSARQSVVRKMLFIKMVYGVPSIRLSTIYAASLSPPTMLTISHAARPELIDQLMPLQRQGPVSVWLGGGVGFV